MNSNTCGRIVKTSVEIEDQIMKVLPKSVADWLRYEAPSNYDVVELFKAQRAGMSEERMLEELKGHARVSTMRAYGDMHPQLPTARHEFEMGRNPYSKTLAKAA